MADQEAFGPADHAAIARKAAGDIQSSYLAHARSGHPMANNRANVSAISSPRTDKPVSPGKYESAWGKGEMPADDATDEQ